MRILSAETFIPKEIRETYLILIGFWASYLFGNIIYSSTSDLPTVSSYILGGIFVVFLGIALSSHFDNKAAVYGTFAYYFAALLIWILVCYFLFKSYDNLTFDPSKTSMLNKHHIWLGSFIYICRIVATEITSFIRYLFY